MKILKPGKVEQRKFVCPDCGCIFAVRRSEMCELTYGFRVTCPQEGCGYEFTDDGEPYEEPTPTQTDRERLKGLLRLCECWQCDETRLDKMTEILLNNGVTFRVG